MGGKKSLNGTQLKSIIEKASDAIIITDEEGKIVEWNDSAEKILELKRSDAMDKYIWDIQYQLAPDEKKSDQLYDKIKTMLLEVLKTGELAKKYEQPIDKEIQCYDGRRKIVQSSTFAVPSEKGAIVVGILRDVTEQRNMEKELQEYKDHLEKMLDKRTTELKESNIRIQLEANERIKAEKSLRKSEKLFRRFVEMSSDGITIVNREGKIVEWNKALENISGLKSESVLGKYIWDVQYSLLPDERRTPEIYERIKSISEQLLKGKHSDISSRIMENNLINASGEIRTVQSRAFPIDNENGYSVGSIIRDITEQKRIEQALKEERDRLETITKNMNVSMAVISRDFKIIWANRVLKGLFRENIEGKECYKTFAGLKNICSDCGIKKVFDENLDSYTYESPAKNADRSISWFQIIVTAMRDEKGEINSALELIIPITEFKMTQEALRKSEEEYRTLFELTLSPIIVLNSDGTILQINQAGVDMLGYDKADELIGKPIVDICFDKNQVAMLANEMRNKGYLKSSELDFIKKDGSIANTLISVRARYNENGEITRYEGFYSDITERRRTEQELMKIQKLESLGIFAGGIAHDLNNILTPILGNISLARIQKDYDKIAERLLEAEKATLMARDLTQQLLTFSKGGAPIKRPTSISHILKDSVNFALRGTDVRPEISIPNDLWAVDIDEGQISQVITNIILNADQAMPDGGIIEIRAENVFINEDSLPLKNGEYVKITIKDHGIGIPEKYLSKIFDPYWTTKKTGSGLGLATSYSIIRNHDGYIDVESQIGVGSTFYIYLPALSEMILTEKEELVYEPIMGKGNILLMDNDDMVRELATKMLETAGYSVTKANDGGEAIRLYREAMESGHPYDVVILDLTVPGGMGGKEAMKFLLKTDPNIKAIASSGYSNDSIMSEYKKYGFTAVIAKPYKVRELSEIVSKVIGNEDK
ncbi:TPA: PAS domain S-box protein [Candidatus Poribacteria bacterium]|nr:PAS domain S-box protein [Candidatus Poribacteria bacterium]